LPPRTHNLIYLLSQLDLRPPAGLDEFVASLSGAHVTTRYPEDLDALSSEYPEERVRGILDRANEVLAWIRAQR
jgi:HEPN domain-containing protein